MEGESFKELLHKLALRHERDVAELQRQVWPKESERKVEEERGSGEGRAVAGPRVEDAEKYRSSRWPEEVKPKISKVSFMSLSSLWKSQKSVVEVESGMGLKRILQEGSPRASIVSARDLLDRVNNNYLAALLLKYVERWHHIKEPPRRGLVVDLIHSRSFQNLSMFVILANAVWITYLTDWSLQHPQGSPPEYQAVELAFIVFFFLEALLRLMVHRCYFFVNYNAGWNWLDFTLVVLSIVELLVSWSTGRITNGGTVTSLRVLRLLKFARILRSLKVITAFRELAMMLESFRSCLAAMFWSLVLLIFLVFICALLFAQGVADGLHAQDISPLEAQDKVMLHFGSVLQTMLTLYMSVTGGNDWSIYYEVLSDLNSFYHILFIAYTFFFAFAIFNILTGIFVERAVAASLPDREQQILLERRKLLEQANELRDLFSCMDLDNSGFISLDEFLACMKDPRIVAYMSSVGVSVHDVEHLFKIVANANDEVDIDRFVDGCMAIKGSATALDMQKQLYYIQELSKTLQAWEKRFWPKLLDVKSELGLGPLERRDDDHRAKL